MQCLYDVLKKKKNLLATVQVNCSYYDHLGAARDIYGAMYPGEPFLPRAPDPEEILLGGEEDSEQQPILDETAQGQSLTCSEEAPDQPMADVQMPEQLKGTASENERD